MAYVDATPVYENITMQASYLNNELSHYRIYPVEGYVLHDKALDWDNTVLDEDGNPVMDFDPETGEPTYQYVTKLGYTTGSATMGANYDFAANPREFYAVPAREIFSGGSNDHTPDETEMKNYE